MTSVAIETLLRRGSLVKICGIREAEHAEAAASAGADLLGFIFAPARRQVTPENARACIEAARAAGLGRTMLAIGVFVDASPQEIRRVAEIAGLDAVQLQGSESPRFVEGLGLPVLKALRPHSGARAVDVISEITSFEAALLPPAGYLIEGYSTVVAGGGGVRVDWGLAAQISAEQPILLAGGLDEANVAEAIGRTRPLGVDVSSGVETHGVKDRERIGAFIRAARSAFLVSR